MNKKFKIYIKLILIVMLIGINIGKVGAANSYEPKQIKEETVPDTVGSTDGNVGGVHII